MHGDLINVYTYTHGLYKVPEGLLEFETRPTPGAMGHAIN
jgi:hypothetical protein